MAAGGRAMWFALIGALVVAALAVLPSALADDGPRLSARHHTIEKWSLSTLAVASSSNNSRSMTWHQWHAA